MKSLVLVKNINSPSFVSIFISFVSILFEMVTSSYYFDNPKKSTNIFTSMLGLG